MASEPNSGVNWPTVGVGVVSFLVGNYLLDKIRTATRTKRLKSALLVHCLETLIKLGKEEFKYERVPKDDAHDWNVIVSHPRGYVLSPPPDEPKELVTLLDGWQARLVVRFYERWELFIRFENLYSELHAQLVTIAATCCEKNQDDAKELRKMKEEYWEQLRGTLADMRTTAAELCMFSCKLFQAFSGPCDEQLAEASERRWSKRAEFNAEQSHYIAILEASQD